MPEAEHRLVERQRAEKGYTSWLPYRGVLEGLRRRVTAAGQLARPLNGPMESEH
jgi:hypothetical protein